MNQNEQKKPEKPENTECGGLYIGQEVIGKFMISNGYGHRPGLGFPLGHIVEITKTGFKAEFKGLKGLWPYSYKDIGAIVYTLDQDAEAASAELIDKMMEEERLGIEDE